MSRNIYRKAHRTGLVSADIFRPGVDNVAALKLLTPNDIWDGTLIHVRDDNSIYAYDLESVAVDDGANILTPTTEVGRWLKIGFGGTGTATSGTADKWVDVTKITSSETVTVDLSTSSDWPQEVQRNIIEVEGTLDVVDGYVLSGDENPPKSVVVFPRSPSTHPVKATEGVLFVSDGNGGHVADHLYFKSGTGSFIDLSGAAGGNEALDATLVLGNSTGGNDIILSTGDKFVGQTNVEISAATNSNVDLIASGTGAIRILSGDPSDAITFVQLGENQETGVVHIKAGMFGPNGVLVLGMPDLVFPISQASGTTTVDVRVASPDIQTNTTGSGVGTGSLTLRSGDAKFTSPGTVPGNSGSLDIASGQVTGAGDSGHLSIRSGSSTAGNSGDLKLESGLASAGTSGKVDLRSANGAQVSGIVQIETGATTAAGGAGTGQIILKTGSASGGSIRGHVAVDADSFQLKRSDPAGTPPTNWAKLNVSDGTGPTPTNALFYTTDAGAITRLDIAAQDREHINMPEAPNNTVEYIGWVSRDCTLKKIKVLCFVANTVGAHTLQLTRVGGSGGASSNLLSVGTYDLNHTSVNGNLTDATVTTLTPTSTAPDLDLNENTIWKISVASNDPGLTAAGIYIDLVFEAR